MNNLSLNQLVESLASDFQTWGKIVSQYKQFFIRISKANMSVLTKNKKTL